MKKIIPFIIVLFGCSEPVVKEYNSESGLTGIGKYKNEKRDGTWVYVTQEGDTAQIHNFKEGARNGQSLVFKKGILIDSTNYVNGKLNGGFKMWHENGQLAFEGNFSSGKQEGIHKTYHSNGQLRQQFTMNNGEFTGEALTYHPNGVKAINGSYDGGIWTYFDSTGNIIGKLEFAENMELLDTIYMDTAQFSSYAKDAI